MTFNAMLKDLLLLLAILFVSGCSALAGLATNAVTGAVKQDKPLVGVDTEVVAGDKKQGVDASTGTKLDDVVVKDNASITSKTTGKQNEIHRAENVTLNEGIPYWQTAIVGLVMLLVGLFAPQLVIRKK